MTTYVVEGGTPRKPTAAEWKTFFGRLPELIRQGQENNLDLGGVNFTVQRMIEGKVIKLALDQVVSVEPEVLVPNLTQTGPTLADWLKARERLHQFLTGDEINFGELFDLGVIQEELLRTDLMPAFRPAGATNRMVVGQLKRCGVDVEEEVPVEQYHGSKGLEVPKLWLIKRLVRPDEDTLGANAKTPDQLVKLAEQLNKQWLGLYGYADAFTLYYLVTGKYLDPVTWTWFPSDRLSGDRVATGRWGPDSRRLWLGCGTGYASPSDGARAAIKVPLKP